MKRPTLSVITCAGDQFTKSAISEFVYKNKLPLVTNFTRDSASQIFENPIKKQVIHLLQH